MAEKRKQVIEWKRDRESQTVTAIAKESGKQMSLAYGDLHESVIPDAHTFLVTQILSTRTSSVQGGDAKIDAMMDVAYDLANGVWKQDSVGGRGGLPIIYAAVARAFERKHGTKYTEHQISEARKRYDDETWQAIVASPAVQAAKEEIRSEREAAVPADISDLADLAS